MTQHWRYLDQAFTRISSSCTLFHADHQRAGAYALPSRRARRQFACSITTEQPPDTQSHCSCITTQQHFTCDTDLASQACEEMTGPALSPRIEVLTTRQMMGRVPPLTHVEISIKFKSVFLPVSVRQLNLPDRSVRQAAFFPQVVRFCYVIYETPPSFTTNK